MRGILRVGSRKVWFYIVVGVIVGLVAGYVVLSSPDSPRLQSEEGILDLTQAQLSTNPQN